MSRFSFFSLLLVCLVSCNQKDLQSQRNDVDDCEIVNLKDAPVWLKNKVADLERESASFKCAGSDSGCFYIAKGVIKGKAVLEIGICCANTNSIPIFYQCDGTLFCDSKNTDCPTFNDVSNRKIIWQTPNGN